MGTHCDYKISWIISESAGTFVKVRLYEGAYSDKIISDDNQDLYPDKSIGDVIKVYERESIILVNGLDHIVSWTLFRFQYNEK